MNKPEPEFELLANLDGIRQLAGAAVFGRGEEYFKEGRVLQMQVERGKLSASVEGSVRYQVTFEEKDGKLLFACTCPSGRDSVCCEHCIALGLAWRNIRLKEAAQENPYLEVKAWLSSQDQNALATILFDHAQWDKALFRTLAFKAARQRAGDNVGALRGAIDCATAVDRTMDRPESRALIECVNESFDALEKAITIDAAATADLCIHAFRRIKRALEYVDDHDGDLLIALERAVTMHLYACKSASPDPLKLASTLFALELKHSEFHGALDNYADILGETGCGEYRRLAGAAREDATNRRVFTLGIEPIRNGKLHETIRRYSKNLSNPRAFVEIIRACREHRHFDEALVWARKGAEAFQHERLAVLDALLAEELSRAGNHSDAAEIAWRSFAGRPSKATLAQLHTYAGLHNAWKLWRDKAVAHLRELIAKENEWAARETRSLLVEIYLEDKNIESALTEAKGACRWDTLTTLAATCAQNRPEDALMLYHRLVPEILDCKINSYYTVNHGYQQAAQLMRSAAEIYRRRNQTALFTDWHEAVRKRYKSKRKFIELLDAIVR